MLTRDEFREGVFDRDKHLCVVPGCARKAVDAHHIMERHLWHKDDAYPEGYHLANGASVCEEHHRACEANAIPPQALRRWLGLPTVLPKQLDPSKIWNKWGEVNKPLIISVKMDGSNVVVTNERVAARNGLEASHGSFNYLKAQHAEFRHRIPDKIQIFGEWLFAKHSIHYTGDLALGSLLQVFAVYEQETQLFWPTDEVMSFCEQAGFVFVPVVARTQFEKEWQLVEGIHKLADQFIKQGHEGLVVKSVYPYHYSQHAENVAKIVRPNHVQTNKHWKEMPIVKNEVK